MASALEAPFDPSGLETTREEGKIGGIAGDRANRIEEVSRTTGRPSLQTLAGEVGENLVESPTNFAPAVVPGIGELVKVGDLPYRIVAGGVDQR